MSRPSSQVERHSVQQQFQALNSTKANLKSDKEAADHEQLKIDGQLQQLHNYHRELTEQNRVAQEELGSFNARRTDHEQARACLSRQMELDKSTLINCTEQALGLEAEESKYQGEYCQTVKKSNATCEDLLRQLESSRLKTLLSPETVKALHQLWTEKEADQMQTKEREVKEATFEDAVSQWQTAIGHLHQGQATKDRLEQQLMDFRDKFLRANPGVTMEQLMNGEMRWKSPRPPTRLQDPIPQNVHLDAFYGTGSENASALTEETGLAGFRDDCSLYAEAIEEHLAVATNAGNENSSAGELGGDNSAEASGGSDVTYKN